MSNKQQPLHKAGRLYVQKLIRMRKALIRKGVNSLVYAPEAVEELDRLLQFWSYSTSAKMAHFINNKSEKIMYLIPGPNCRAHKSLLSEFNSLYVQSRQILHHESIC